ncbi:hypothetical protein EJ07DRAFT_125600 [Lizonia empirigonia]|nr:hypothetical protein EJ07DRAFT_125600 [Lizonia empirigonia]
MSSLAFDAQLLGPDNNESQLRLVDLIAAGCYTGTGLPDVAHRYLDAFCNKSYSNGRRRWAGIALAGMLRASASVVQRLKKLSHGPSRLGAIILDQEESEERRIIAGLIVRQGLEAGIDFIDFWESEKVLHSAPNFPRDSNEQWMGQFQTYLDTLGSLALVNLNTDPLILFPMSFCANDGFQWTGKSAVAVLEKNMLTIIVSDSTLTKVQFLDIPISHVKETSLQQDSPHESQEGRSGHKMYTLIMTLGAEPVTYCLNSSNRTASEFKVSFLRQEDADEFEVGVHDARKNLTHTTSTPESADSSASSNHPEDLPHSPVERIDPSRLPNHQEDDHDNSDPPTIGIVDESPDQRSGEVSSTQRASQNKGKGKLPRISDAIKQKVTQLKQLPPGRSKVTKSRSSTKKNPVVYEDEDGDENEESSQDEYDLKSKVPAHIPTGPNNGRKSRGRRKAKIEDDDEFVPAAASRAKPKTTKRKRGSSDSGEESRPKKKTQIKHSDAAQQNVRNENSARRSLIGELVKSKSPSKAAAPAFKKPGQPASTPGKPRAPAVRPSPKSQTPMETHTNRDGFPVHISSSTPRSQAIHDEDFGLHYTPADTEILSSNTKRVPDSPHAESTAISGHADCDEIHREKRIGDMELARSDPFKQRRQGQKVTSLMRRFTDESATNNDPESRPGDGSHDARMEPNPSKRSRLNIPTDASHDRRGASDVVSHRAQADDSIIFAPCEAVEDTLPYPPAQVKGDDNLDGDTTLVEEEVGFSDQYAVKVSDLRFRSSPPIPDSSSVCDASDASEEEPEPSPPTSRADELEWEAALEPHQRALYEQLLRTSKRVVRHIVDNETAVTDITEAFADDGERVLDLLLERQRVEHADAFENLANKQQELLKALCDTSKSLKAQRRQAKTVE